jgi:outer membrane protein assembly factor BamE (lipoprotein component of BamABCDE complex)
MKKLLSHTHLFKLLLLSLSLVFSTGCWSSKMGRELSREQVSQVRKGMTRSQVESLIGSPNHANPDGQGGMIFYYNFMNTKVRASSYIPVVGSFAGGADTEQKNVTVYFDRYGKVKDIISNY